MSGLKTRMQPWLTGLAAIAGVRRAVDRDPPVAAGPLRVGVGEPREPERVDAVRPGGARLRDTRPHEERARRGGRVWRADPDRELVHHALHRASGGACGPRDRSRRDPSALRIRRSAPHIHPVEPLGLIGSDTSYQGSPWASRVAPTTRRGVRCPNGFRVSNTKSPVWGSGSRNTMIFRWIAAAVYAPRPRSGGRGAAASSATTRLRDGGLRRRDPFALGGACRRQQQDEHERDTGGRDPHEAPSISRSPTPSPGPGGRW